MVLIVMGLCFAGFVFVTQSTQFYLVWFVFSGKTFLAFAILTVQILSLLKTKRMVLNTPDIQLNRPVYFQTLFIFVFFAVNVVF